MIRSPMQVLFGVALLTGCASAPEIRTDDGVPIRYTLRGSGAPALVFLHGWCCDRSSWREQIEVLAVDHEVVAIDLAGHGESRGQRAQWSIAGLADDVRLVVDALGFDDMVLIGHSMGAPVALAAAARMPGRVRAVIGVDALHDVEREFPRAQFEEMVRGFEADFSAMMRRAVAGMVGPQAAPTLTAAITATALGTEPEVALALLRGFAQLDQRGLLRDAGVPVRCINSAAPYPTAIASNRKYADFDATILEGVGHFPMLERPTAFNAELGKMIEASRLPGTPSTRQR